MEITAILSTKTVIERRLWMRRLEDSMRIMSMVYCDRGFPIDEKTETTPRERTAIAMRHPYKPIIARTLCRDFPTNRYNRLQDERGNRAIAEVFNARREKRVMVSSFPSNINGFCARKGRYSQCAICRNHRNYGYV